MIPENVHVTLYDGFVFYSGDAQIALGMHTAGYFWTDRNRIGIRVPRILGHELLGLLVCKANNVTDEHEDECIDAICYASPFSTNSGLCERHRKIVEDKLAGTRIGLDVLIYSETDIQKLKKELDKTIEGFLEKTSIDAYFNSIKISRKRIRNGSWLIRRDGIEVILPPMELDDVYRHNPTRIFLMYGIPFSEREGFEKRVETNKVGIRQRLSEI